MTKNGGILLIKIKKTKHNALNGAVHKYKYTLKLTSRHL
jgi:hypothetical protein